MAKPKHSVGAAALEKRRSTQSTVLAPLALVTAVARVPNAATGIPLYALRRWQARRAQRRHGKVVPRRPENYTRGGEAVRNSTFTHTGPTRTIASHRAAS